MDTLLLSISLLLHLIATVVWLGGLAIFTLYFWPLAHKNLASEQQRQIVLDFLARFRPIANFSLIVLLGTGMLQLGVNDNYDGVLTFENTWSLAMLLKHIAFGGMIVIAGIIQFGIVPATERATILASRGDSSELDIILHRERHLLRWMLGLGLMVLLFTAIATAA